MSKNKPELTADCCAVWSKLVTHFGWFTYSDWPDIATMPYIRDSNGDQWRINHCPSCGAVQRDATRLAAEVGIAR